MKKWTRREILPLAGLGLAAGALMAGATKEKDTTQKFSNYVKCKTPQRLRQGDYVGICAPAGALRRDEEIQEFTVVLESLGFKVKVGANCRNQYGYFAGTDQERAADFMHFIDDPEVRAIFFLRGGWGCARILPYINFVRITANPKVIMGFSDVTTLLNTITKNCRLVTYHGPSGNSSWNEFSKQSLRKVLMEGDLVQYNHSDSDSPLITYNSGVARGLLWGGNLTVICSLLGTSDLPNFEGGILFLEDVGEEPYSIDRMLTQLKASRVFDNVNGIILGNFRKCIAEEPHRSFTLEEVFEQHFKPMAIPVFYGAQIGHTVNKFTVPLGVRAEMDADKGSFQLLETAVE